MMNQDPIRTEFSNLREDATVFDRSGNKLGKVAWVQGDQFCVQKGLFFPREFTLRTRDIQDVRGDDIYLNLDSADLESWKNESYEGWNQVDDINAGRLNASPRDEFKDRYAGWFGSKDKLDRTRRDENINIPVMEEQLQAETRQREAGAVNVRKVVHTELKHFTVPVTREEVRVERTPATGAERADLRAGDKAFREETIRVPVMEEEVTVTKRPVLKENVRVTKERITESKEVSGKIRKEEIDIDDQSALLARKKRPLDQPGSQPNAY